MAITWILAALTTGLVGSLHCVGMCGPLAMALPVGRLPVARRGLGIGLYHLARVSAYAGIGLVVGSVGQGLLLLNLQRPVSIGAGLFLVVWTMVARGKFGSLSGRLPSRWLVGSMARFLHEPSLRAFAALGLLNGLLPCGFVYVALAGAVVTGNVGQGALYMILFGAGTVPALLAVRSIPALFPVGLRQRFVRIIPLATLALGVLLVVRGVYVAPPASPDQPPIPLCHGKTTSAK
ncbi:hypothetical protein GGR92_003498 [Spirosoma lacussanchae]|uniref:sulfite exporter TauE/SafE family protein n=1 Tax=Spirosoma lacussanchae TaxID=1884249 RepID=UPI001109B49F|nr:sulfite exporter TauE/SafE family protein [Spirosoma lacussanchae]